nr:lysophospholipid acyltransferase family protein [Qipengyuania polymorpha]
MLLLLRNLVFYPLFYLGSFLITAASLVAAPFSLAAFRRRVRDWGRWQRWCLRHIIGADVVIEGNYADQPVLYAIKHESFFEAIDAPNLLECPSVFAKQELFAIPGWGRAALAYGLIPVARDKGAKMLMGMIRSAKKMVADGRPLVIFPEGTRVPHGERRPLQAGFAGLYKMLGLPVVPVAVSSGEVYHRWLKKPGTITYRFGETIPPGLPREEVEAKVLDAINALNA